MLAGMTLGWNRTRSCRPSRRCVATTISCGWFPAGPCPSCVSSGRLKPIA
jgi:hypothetical protein